MSDHLHPLMLFCYPRGVFQQDNCTSHSFRLATVRMYEYSADSPIINWSPRSPDLNPIEHTSSVYFLTMRDRPSHSINEQFWPMFGKPFPWNVSRNLLNLCLVVWQPLSRPDEIQLMTR
ncbi:DDE_3 domain-containing protein [Trichonephila clavipes]|nr:DDE_3 domain-containing protein [Trichonephila clavipes]